MGLFVTLNIMISNITTLSIKGSFVTLSMVMLCHFTECCVSFIAMLNIFYAEYHYAEYHYAEYHYA
jgi:hypothetical protein